MNPTFVPNPYKADGASPSYMEGAGSPEGVQEKPLYYVYKDTDTDGYYLKMTASGTTGWEAVGGSSGSAQIAWEPSSVSDADFWELLGVFTDDHDDALPGVTALTLNQATTSQGFDIEQCISLTSVSAPNLSAITGFGCAIIKYNAVLETVSLPSLVSAINIEMTDNPSLTSFDFSSLESATYINLGGNTSLVSLDLPSLSNLSGRDFNLSDATALETASFPSLETVRIFYMYGNTSLTTVTFGSLTAIGTSLTIAGCALSEATVNAILAELLAINFVGYAALNDGTNSPPTGQGLLDLATLRGNGATIDVNS